MLQHEWALTNSTSSTSAGGRRCPQLQQVRCQQIDCTFRSLDSDGTLTTASTSAAVKDDL